MSQIRAYAARHQLEEQVTKHLEEIIRTTDRAYLKWTAEQQAKNAGK